MLSLSPRILRRQAVIRFRSQTLFKRTKTNGIGIKCSLFIQRPSFGVELVPDWVVQHKFSSWSGGGGIKQVQWLISLDQSLKAIAFHRLTIQTTTTDMALNPSGVVVLVR